MEKLDQLIQGHILYQELRVVEKWSLSENYSVPIEEWQIDAGCQNESRAL